MVVQGVGFRPFVYRLALEFELKGSVSNSGSGVHIYFSAEDETAQTFYQKCIADAPQNASISEHSMEVIEVDDFNSFQIIESDNSTDINLGITPDFAICDSCKAEIKQSENRRVDYAFNTCTECGPRYSIMKEVPFDRDTTTMDAFPMCADCQSEYENTSDRRFYAQTISCKSCGVKLNLAEKSGVEISDQTVCINKIVQAISAGQIVAVKGLTGYLFCCDATSPDAIQTLRDRKHRSHKPFAVMFPDLNYLSEFKLSNSETALLTGKVSPVLITAIPENSGELALDQIAPQLSQLGVMLPNSPLMHLICQALVKPIIATSANISGSPIVANESETSMQQLFSVADLVLSHNREITFPQDDSVIKFTPQLKRQIILRRSRGLAPNVFEVNSSEDGVLALGAELKGSFAMSHSGRTFVSQYAGNLLNYDNQERFKEQAYRFQQLLKTTPKRFVSDLHPEQFSQQLCLELDPSGINTQKVQHHEAHFTAVLAENELLESDQNILGVVWDGTGFGTDGNIWGGEFFSYRLGEITRVDHIDEFIHFAGDKFSQEPRLATLSIFGRSDLVKSKFTDKELSVYLNRLNASDLKSTSMGRIFDAVSSILGLTDYNSYEGFAAMLVEQKAQEYFDVIGYDFDLTFELDSTSKTNMSYVLKQIAEAFSNGEKSSLIAAKFHNTLVQLIDQIATENQAQVLAFSGGCFQNGILCDLIEMRLGNRFQLAFHKQLSPNDENISFGQFMHPTVTRIQQTIQKLHSICA
tara:strand:+ start:7339 stop:9603 length:2265 start_codon:yes stop_codon:yes gene_type:complete